jgi:hypothetical protein
VRERYQEGSVSYFQSYCCFIEHFLLIGFRRPQFLSQLIGYQPAPIFSPILQRNKPKVFELIAIRTEPRPIGEILSMLCVCVCFRSISDFLEASSHAVNRNEVSVVDSISPTRVSQRFSFSVHLFDISGIFFFPCVQQDTRKAVPKVMKLEEMA